VQDTGQGGHDTGKGGKEPQVGEGRIHEKKGRRQEKGGRNRRIQEKMAGDRKEGEETFKDRIDLGHTVIIKYLYIAWKVQQCSRNFSQNGHNCLGKLFARKKLHRMAAELVDLSRKVTLKMIGHSPAAWSAGHKLPHNRNP
jgi:hypothetical protein